MSEQKEWYRNWFDSPYYDLLYKDRDQDEADMFIYNLVKYLSPKKNSLMLDLACGKGRYSVALHQQGYHVTGIDLSERKIETAKQQPLTPIGAKKQGLSFMVHDMRMPFEVNKYDYVFNLFTSFGYFDNEEENRAVIFNVYNALKKGGVFVLDYMNGEKIAKYLLEHEECLIEGVSFSIYRYVKNNFIVKEINVKDGVVECNFTEKISIFTEEKLKQYMIGCGLEILETFGNYQLHKFDPIHSDRLIIISRKP